MRIWSANLGRGVSTKEFTQNLWSILDHAGKTSIICFQEIDEADQPLEMQILKGMTHFTHNIFGAHTAVPILVPEWMKVVSAGVTPACEGLAEFTPNRVVNEVVVKLTGSGEVAVLNTHLPINRDETVTRRAQCRKVLRERCAVHERGVWCADTNTRDGFPQMAKGERMVVDAGIDKIAAWGDGLKLGPSEVLDLTIDNHDAHGAQVWWAR
jgi:hypothetical protein